MDPKELARRVYKARMAAGLSQAELAEKVGMAQTGIAAVEIGRSTRPRKIAEIAKVLNVPLSYFLGAGEVEYVPVSENGRVLQVKETSAAGVWTQEGHQFVTKAITVAADPRYPFDEQFAILVNGNSANKVAPDGSIALCVEISDRLIARDGDLVFCRRYRGDDEDRLIETSIRRFNRNGDARPVLTLESNDPAYQTPIEVDDGVMLAGIVISVINHLR